MNLHQQLQYNMGVFMYKALNYTAPEYISNMYTHPPSRYSNSRNNYLDLPRTSIDIFKTSIAYAGALLWNNLPLNIRPCSSLCSSKRNLCQHLKAFTQYYGSEHNYYIDVNGTPILAPHQAWHTHTSFKLVNVCVCERMCVCARACVCVCVRVYVTVYYLYLLLL